MIYVDTSERPLQAVLRAHKGDNIAKFFSALDSGVRVVFSVVKAVFKKEERGEKRRMKKGFKFDPGPGPPFFHFWKGGPGTWIEFEPKKVSLA